VTEGLIEVDVGLVAVDLVNVDPVGVQAPKRVLHLADDPAAGVAAAVGVLPHLAPDLRREHDIVALAAGERLADDDLRLSLRVDIRGVDEVDPGVQPAVDDPDRLVVVLGAPVAEHHGAEAQLAHRDAGASEGSMLHR
jgi:hypothetical protein